RNAAQPTLPGAASRTPTLREAVFRRDLSQAPECSYRGLRRRHIGKTFKVHQIAEFVCARRLRLVASGIGDKRIARARRKRQRRIEKKLLIKVTLYGFH